MADDIVIAAAAAVAEIDGFLRPLRELRDLVLAIRDLPLDEARSALVAEAFTRFADSMRTGGHRVAFDEAREVLRMFHDQLKEHIDG